MAPLDEEVQDALRRDKNFNTYKGAIYENIVGDMLVKQEYQFFYGSEKKILETDFFLRDINYLIPIVVKANDVSTSSLNTLIGRETYSDIQYAIKLANEIIDFNGRCSGHSAM